MHCPCFALLILLLLDWQGTTVLKTLQFYANRITTYRGNQELKSYNAVHMSCQIIYNKNTG